MSIVISLAGRSDFDPKVLGFYAYHLARAAGHLGIRYGQDTYSIDGTLIGLQNQPFILPQDVDPLRLKLTQSIYVAVNYDHVFDAKKIWADLLTVLNSDDLLSSLNEHQPLRELVEPFLAELEAFPELQKALSVMAISQPDLYERSLYCVWFTLVIAHEMKASAADRQVLFLASLAHDLGMLHLSPEVLTKAPPLTQAEWIHVQKHVSIARRWLMEVALLPRDVVQAVYEHHERCDGTGYPLGIVESEISYAGKVLGLADTLIAIYHNRFKPKGRGWRNVIPLMQMNAQEFFYRHGEILATIWRRSEMPKKQVVDGDNLVDFFEQIQQKHNELHEWFHLLKTGLSNLGFTHGDRQLHSLQNVMLHIATSVRGSGIFNPEVAEWFQTVDIENDQTAYAQLDRAAVLQQEIRFHLQKMSHMAQSYVDSGICPDQNIVKVLKNMLAESRQYL